MKLGKDFIRKKDTDFEEIFKIKEKRYFTILEKLRKDLNLKKTSKILEIGSGVGIGLICFKDEGYNIIGIEPNSDSIKFAKKNLKKKGYKENIISKEFAENLSFKENSFDFIICRDVIEHVQSIQGVIEEMLRVLKPKGIAYIACPDYLFPYEGHFKVPYPPLCPKFIGKIYLRFFGFSKEDVNFLDHINYTTNRNIFKVLKKTSFKINNIHFKNLKGFKKVFYQLFKISLSGKVEMYLIKNE